MRLASGGNIAQACGKLKDGETLELETNGAYVGGKVSTIKRPIVIVGNGARVLSKTEPGLYFQSCGPVTVEDLVISGMKLYGLSVIECQSVTLKRLILEKNGKTGILTSNTSDVHIEGCRCVQSGIEHGIYCSQSGDRLRLIGNTCNRNGKSGIQINGVAPDPDPDNPNWDSISHDVLISGNVLGGNQIGPQGGGAALNLSGVTGIQILNNTIQNHGGNHGISMWDDDAGDSRFAVHDAVLDGNSFTFAKGKGKSCVNVKKGCSNIVIKGSNVFPSGIKDVESNGVIITR